MKQTTLVLVFNDNDEVLLCMKKRGFGVGKYNGAGGKVEEGETIIEAAKRELQEETGVDVSTEKLEKIGLFHFSFLNKPEWNQDVTLFVTKHYNGEIEETEEMKPEWFKTSEIPFTKMWDDDRFWMPRILKGEQVEYEFLFDENGKVMEHKQII